MRQIDESILMDVRGLKKYFPIERGLFKKLVGYVRAVDDVSFQIMKGESVGIVGESGCGKTTTARSVMRAIDPTEGEVLFRSRRGVVDMAKLNPKELKPIRSDMQMIFQDPYSSLNSRMTIQDIVAEPLRAQGVPRQERMDKVSELLKLVGLRETHMTRYPHAFSGGQRQRIGIARALSLNPSLLVADEPVSALDVSVQAQILNLLQDLQKRFHLSFFFVAHDLSVIRHFCDRVVVLYLGRVAETANNQDLFSRPRHPYTSALLRAIPDADPHAPWNAEILGGEVTAPPSTATGGCLFAPRCKYAQEICRQEVPPLKDVATAGETASSTQDSGSGSEAAGPAPGIHQAACHFAGELELEGILE